MAPVADAGRRVDGLRPEDFALPSAELAETLRAVTKELFDLAKQHDVHGFGVLNELYVANFDLEQIWEQLQLHNGPLLQHLEKSVRSLVVQRDEIDLTPLGEEGEDSEEGTDTGDEEAEEESDLDLGLPSGRRARGTRGDGGGKEEAKGREGKRGNKEERRRGVGGGAKSVEDLLDEMDSFVEQAERGQVRGGGSDGDDDDDDDEDDEDDEEGDEFGIGIDGEEEDGLEEGEEDDEEEGDEEDDMDDEEGEEEDGDGSAEELGAGAEARGGSQRAARNGTAAREEESEEEEEDFEAGADADMEDGTTVKQPTSLSAHELRLLRIQEKIEALEHANVSDKPWQLRGEVAAAGRPLNSLLEEHIDFEAAARPAPAITQEVTASMEDVIKARILQGLFDDVERRAPPDARQLRPKAAELSQAKSSKGLADEYEEEYRARAMGQDRSADQASAKHGEISLLLASLFGQLDALTNAHFTPHLSRKEVEVRPNLPALTMEEAMPTALSLAQGLSAAEVKAPQHLRSLPSTVELNRSERKAKRNAHKHRQAREKRRRIGAEREQPLSAAAQLDKELAAAKRSKTARVTSSPAAAAGGEKKARPSYTRSAQLFGKMQQEQGKFVRKTTAAERGAKGSRTAPGASFKL